MTDLLQNQRHLFDIPEDVAYLNCATMGPMPKTAIEAGIKGLARKAQPWGITTSDFFADTKRLRPKLAQLINADTDGIAFIPSVSYAMAIAAQNLYITADQSIVTMADQFPSNVYVWRDVAARTGATLKAVSNVDGNMSLSDAMLEAIGSETAIVACSHVRWTDGAKLDLVAIGARCREAGAALVLDLTQSCGAMAFDVATVKPDFMVAAGYKWLFGPYSTAFMYAAPHRREGRPLEQGLITREGATDFTQLTSYRDGYETGAQRYDMGERSNFALLPAFEAAVDLLLDWGVNKIEATLGANNRALAAKLTEIGLHCPAECDRGPHYLGAALPAQAPSDLTEQLAREKIYISQRGTSLRISPHVYNTQDDMDRTVEALARLISG